MTKYFWRLAVVLTRLVILFGYSMSSNAAPEKIITIKGKVYAANPCVINNKGTSRTQFNEVQTNKIDGTYNTVAINYELNCSEAPTNSMRLQIRGEEAPWDSKSLIVPGFYNLGIRLFIGDEWLPLNVWKPFNARFKPSLKASIHKPGPGEIKTGAFKASATLVVESQ